MNKKKAEMVATIILFYLNTNQDEFLDMAIDVLNKEE